MAIPLLSGFLALVFAIVVWPVFRIQVLQTQQDVIIRSGECDIDLSDMPEPFLVLITLEGVDGAVASGTVRFSYENGPERVERFNANAFDFQFGLSSGDDRVPIRLSCVLDEEFRSMPGFVHLQGPLK